MSSTGSSRSCVRSNRAPDPLVTRRFPWQNSAVEPLLLTPGPLTTSEQTRRAMLRDYGSRFPAFNQLTRQVRDYLVAIAGGSDALVAVPLQGSGTFTVEAALGTFVPPRGRLLVVVNGAYGWRMVDLAERMGRWVTAVASPQDTPFDVAAVDAALERSPDITHVAAVHCETTTGVLNPIEDLAAVVHARGRRLLVDAMSAFGAIPLDMTVHPIDAVMASSNKCLEGVPGVGFTVCRRDALAACEGNAHSVSLDLYDQWQRFEQDGQWRFTPPTHAVAAFAKALEQHRAEGGVQGRRARYQQNLDRLVTGMCALGYEPLLDHAVQAPIIVTFHQPDGFDFAAFYAGLAERGFYIYPGKLTETPTFRVGCIGQVYPADIERFLGCVSEVSA